MNFTWKRKFENVVLAETRKLFEDDIEDADEKLIRSGEIDWLCPTKRKCFQLEDPVGKSNRLKDEGCVLAEEQRFWEATNKFNEAISLTPDSEVLYELLAQAYMQLNEIFPAVSMAEKAVKLKNNWWVAYQTLGRAQLGIGEVQMAVTSFKNAIHLNPDVKELWGEDLHWAVSLAEKKKSGVQDNVDDFQTAEHVTKDFVKTHAIMRC